MKKQILVLGLIFTLSVAVTNCSREEAQKAINGINATKQERAESSMTMT